MKKLKSYGFEKSRSRIFIRDQLSVHSLSAVGVLWSLPGTISLGKEEGRGIIEDCNERKEKEKFMRLARIVSVVQNGKDDFKFRNEMLRVGFFFGKVRVDLLKGTLGPFFAQHFRGRE